MFEAEFWVAVAFFLFIGVLAYLRVHRFVVDGVDARSNQIRAELEDAYRIKQEAQALHAEYRRKASEAEQEAGVIVAGAAAEAERLAAEIKARMEEFVARRTKLAEIKISQAEAQAVAEVRGAAADAAIAAAEKILLERVKGDVANGILQRSIKDVKGLLGSISGTIHRGLP
jgi:F-type H+-transporting ATPase subunit b